MKIKIKKEDIQALLFFIIGLSLLIYSLLEHYALGISWEISPYLFPLLISIFLSVLAALLFFQTIRNTIKPAEIDGFNLDENLEIGEITDKDKSKANKKRFFLVLLLSILYYFLIAYLGFMISTMLFLASLFFILGERRWWMILIVSIVSTLLFEGIFLKLLNVILP